ncbi:MAG: DNA translocase FtsK 4TM domain-containing protein, partial [Cyclobacteriaceae bacterium]
MGIFFIMFSIFLFLAFLSYLFAGQADQSVVSESGEPLRAKAAEAKNLLGYSGALMSHYFIYRWFGLAALLFPPFFFLLGYRLSFKKSLISMTRYAGFAMFFLFWLGLMMGYMVHLIDDYYYLGFLSGGFGYELALLSDEFLGWGTFILIFGSLLIFFILFFNVDQIKWLGSEQKTDQEDELSGGSPEMEEYLSEEIPEPEEDAVEETNRWKLSNKKNPEKPSDNQPAFNVEDTTKISDNESLDEL